MNQRSLLRKDLRIRAQTECFLMRLECMYPASYIVALNPSISDKELADLLNGLVKSGCVSLECIQTDPVLNFEQTLSDQ